MLQNCNSAVNAKPGGDHISQVHTRSLYMARNAQINKIDFHLIKFN